jgi:hypothetical protein
MSEARFERTFSGRRLQPEHGAADMNKVDFTREYARLYRPSATDFELVEVPSLTYLMADGHGDPNTAPAYAQAVEALYALAYRTSRACGGPRITAASPRGSIRASGIGR